MSPLQVSQALSQSFSLAQNLSYSLSQQGVFKEDPSGVSIFSRQHLLEVSKFTHILDKMLL